MQTATSGCDCGHDHHHQKAEDVEWLAFINSVQRRFTEKTAAAKSLHTSSAHGLWEAYLSGFTDDATRQVHNCNTCRHFIESFGNLVVVADDGILEPVMWDLAATPDFYKPAVAAILATMAASNRITQPFYTVFPVLGTGKTGDWDHLSVVMPAHLVQPFTDMRAGRGGHDDKIAAGNQQIAERVHARATIRRALGEFSVETIQRAQALLKTDALPRGGAVAGGIEFLLKTHGEMSASRGGAHAQNLLWRAIAEAPEGHLHPRSGMVGKLLEDLENASLSLDDVKKRFAAAMNPLDYRRPQAAPTAGNIAQGEKTIAKLGLQRSLERRFARLHEIEALWRPAAPKPAPQGEGVFGHLQPRDAAPRVANHASADAQKITFVKFRDTILPMAQSIEAYAGTNGPFAAFVTALYEDAPPIIKWDSEERRNPFTWYTYGSRQSHPGTPTQQWGLRPNSWVKVNAVARSPAEWGAAMNDAVTSYRSAILVLEGAVDSRDSGNALFPEFLRGELHGVSSTIEAFAASAKIHGRAEASAAGLMVSSSGKGLGVTVRVTSHGVTQTYIIDRWD